MEMSRAKRIRQRQLLALLLCVPVVQSVLAQSADGAASRGGHQGRAGISAGPAKHLTNLLAGKENLASENGKTRVAPLADFLPVTAVVVSADVPAAHAFEAGRSRQPRASWLEVRSGRAPPVSASH